MKLYERLSSIKVKEGDTVEVGALLGLVNEGKSSKIETTQEKPTQIELAPKKNKGH